MENLNQRLKEAFANVLYAVAKIDGEVQQVEIDVFKKVIAEHEWGQSIEVLFNRNVYDDSNANIVFLKAMKIFRAHGPSEHYPFFVDLLEKIAEAHDGVVPEERKMIDRFKQCLIMDVNAPH